MTKIELNRRKKRFEIMLESIIQVEEEIPLFFTICKQKGDGLMKSLGEGKISKEDAIFFIQDRITEIDGVKIEKIP